MNMKCICGKLLSSWTGCMFWCSLLLPLLFSVNAAQYELYEARITVNYTEPATGSPTNKVIAGRFGVTSPTEMEVGKVVHVVTEDSLNHGCSPATNAPAAGVRWIALIQRGNCKFEHKIATAVNKNNASAVVIYNHVDEDILITMDHRIMFSISSQLEGSSKPEESIKWSYSKIKYQLADNEVEFGMNVGEPMVSMKNSTERKIP